MNKQDCKTKEELFLYFDSLLNDDERNSIMSTESIALHFSFGLWIRNNIIRPDNVPAIRLFAYRKMDDGRCVVFDDPDEISATIIDEYQQWLQYFCRKHNYLLCERK